MSVSIDNKTFFKVYNKTKDLLESKLYKYTRFRKYGGKIPTQELKVLLLYITYLESIDISKYTYYHIKGLTNISNYLNKI